MKSFTIREVNEVIRRNDAEYDKSKAIGKIAGAAVFEKNMYLNHDEVNRLWQIWNRIYN